MAKQNRDQLKPLFDAGNLPTESNFQDVIDSHLNLSSDGVTITDDGSPDAPRFGLGTTNATTKLDVNGTIRTQNFTLLADDRVEGHVLVSDGEGRGSWKALEAPVTPPPQPEVVPLTNFYALKFDGKSTSILIDDTPAFDFEGSDYAISAWVKRGDINRRQMILSKETAGARQFHLAFTDSNTIQILYSFGPSDAQIVFQSTVNTFEQTGRWMHILGQRRGDSFEIFVNGERQDLRTRNGNHGIMSITRTPFHIGQRAFRNAEDYFNGCIDEVSIWSTSFEDGAALRDFIGIEGPTNPKFSAQASRLVSWWRFGDVSQWNGTKWLIPDASGRGNHGESVSMTESDIVLRQPNPNQR